MSDKKNPRKHSVKSGREALQGVEKKMEENGRMDTTGTDPK